jgi:hypothetical protein
MEGLVSAMTIIALVIPYFAFLEDIGWFPGRVRSHSRCNQRGTGALHRFIDFCACREPKHPSDLRTTQDHDDHLHAESRKLA